MYSLELLRWGDSNEYTQHTFYDKIRNNPCNLLKYLLSWAIKKDLICKNEFELAMVNTSSVFESLRFYCAIAYFSLNSAEAGYSQILW